VNCHTSARGMGEPGLKTARADAVGRLRREPRNGRRPLRALDGPVEASVGSPLRWGVPLARSRGRSRRWRNAASRTRRPHSGEHSGTWTSNQPLRVSTLRCIIASRKPPLDVEAMNRRDRCATFHWIP